MKATRGILTFGATAGLTLSTLGYTSEVNIDIGHAYRQAEEPQWDRGRLTRLAGIGPAWRNFACRREAHGTRLRCD